MTPRTRVLATTLLGGGLVLACTPSNSAEDDGGIALPSRGHADAGEDAAVPDASSSSGGTPVTPACDLSKPFGPIARMTEFDAVTYNGIPSLSADELQVVMQVHEVGSVDFDLAIARRTSRTEPFGAPARLASVNTTTLDSDGTLSADARTIFFSSFRPHAGGGLGDLYSATRSTSTGAFNAPVFLSAVNTADTEYAPGYTGAGGGELWFASFRGGAIGLWRARRSAGTFGAPEAVTDFGTGDAYGSPSPSEDGLRLVFTSNRPGTLGGMDLWIATRSSTTAPFGTPVPVPGVNSESAEIGGWMSADGCRVYFASEREATTEAPEAKFFFAARPPPP